MTPFLLYLLRASLYLAIFYAFYLLVMRRTSLFRFNRIALLVGTVICHLLPLLRLRTVIRPESFGVSVGTLDVRRKPAFMGRMLFTDVPVEQTMAMKGRSYSPLSLRV